MAQLEAENARLRARVVELEAELDLPAKTPTNSSTPPSRGHKASGETKPKAKGRPHAGAHRPLHPNPTSRREVFASSRQHCGADVSQRPQIACEAYDHAEIPDVKPEVTRLTLHGGTCRCARRFKAPPPADIAPGSLHARWSSSSARDRTDNALETQGRRDCKSRQPPRRVGR